MDSTTGMLIRTLDYGRMQRLLRSQNPNLIKRNLDNLANQLVSIVSGSNLSDSETKQLAGKTMRINLRIGILTVNRNSVDFEPFPLTQIVSDSQE